jgi:hypothetical protein
MSRMPCTGMGFFPWGNCDAVFSRVKGADAGGFGRGSVAGAPTVAVVVPGWDENVRKWRLPMEMAVGVGCTGVRPDNWLGWASGGDMTGSRVSA